MRAVNLLPEDTKARRVPKSAVAPVAGAAAALVAVGMVGALAHVEGGKVASKQQRLDDLNLKLSQLQSSPSAGNPSAAALLASRDARITALNSALSGRVSWDVVLRQLALVLPADTWLDSLQMNAPGLAAATATAPAAATGTIESGVTITGYTTTADNLARVLQRLSVVPSLTDVKLTTSQSVQRGRKAIFQFTIGANIATPGGGS
jgi:Tfp pilus assembly protein PilN